MKTINLDELKPHPKNPRLSPREDIVEQIAAQINGELDPAHALIVRQNGVGYEIISGHHRALAARKAGLAEVPCWVRDLSDEDAYMALALNNAQGELSALEIGLHALHSGLSQRAYEEKTGTSRRSLRDYIAAADVWAHVRPAGDMSDHTRALSELHAAPKWLWPALVSRFVEGKWTVEVARREAQKLKEVAEPPEWADAGRIAGCIASGEMKPGDIKQFAGKAEAVERTLTQGGDDAERLIADLHKKLESRCPALLSDVTAVCDEIEQEQQELIRQRRQAELFAEKREEEIRARTARLRKNVSLDEWKELAEDERQALLSLTPKDEAPRPFNKQTNKDIEWAQWTWNPVTGCLHNCPYCYARDIANDISHQERNKDRVKQSYPNAFEPSFRPNSVLAPRTMKVPKEAEGDTRFRNVFTCSMADLFGRWVPAEWIEAVFREVRAAPDWNFLFLTKFPKRMAEFDIPENAWMGTTVDLQARVKAAEKAFDKVKSGVRWLSIEPMLEPIKFEHLDRFDWIVVGGSSKSSQTSKWVPPFEWVESLLWQAREAGCKVYFKTNLGMEKRLLELPFDAPIPTDNTPAPDEFKYLGNQ